MQKREELEIRQQHLQEKEAAFKGKKPSKSKKTPPAKRALKHQGKGKKSQASNNSSYNDHVMDNIECELSDLTKLHQL